MKTIKNISLFCGIVFSIFFVSFMVLAWSAPGSAPTGGNVAIPINESSTSQVKSGALGVSLLQAENNILVGTTDATKATIYSKTPRSSSSFQNAKTNPLRIDGHCYRCENYYWPDGSSWRLRVSRSTTYPALFIEKTTNNVGIGHVFNGSNLPPLSAKLHIAQANMAVSPFHVQHKEYVGPGFSSDQAWRWATSLFIAPYTANVGIGTADPKAKLHVAGDMIVDGNVGIGTARPSAKLHVNGTGIFTGAVIVGDPTLDSHATTKEYVDSKTGGFSTCQTVSGTGTVTCPAGTTVVGGGGTCEEATTVNGYPCDWRYNFQSRFISQPEENGWRVSCQQWCIYWPPKGMENGWSDLAQGSVYAICCQ